MKSLRTATATPCCESADTGVEYVEEAEAEEGETNDTASTSLSQTDTRGSTPAFAGITREHETVH